MFQNLEFDDSTDDQGKIERDAEVESERKYFSTMTEEFQEDHETDGSTKHQKERTIKYLLKTDSSYMDDGTVVVFADGESNVCYKECNLCFQIQVGGNMKELDVYEPQ